MAKIDKIEKVTEIIKEGGAGNSSWKLAKALTEDEQEVTGFNLKDGQSVVLRYNDKYKNYNAVPISGWQEILFEDLEKIKQLIIGGEDVSNP